MAKQKGPVTCPLDPTVLTELGALKAAPPPSPDGFDPAGAWTAVYRIWTCYGHRDRGNQTMGALRLERRPDADGHRLAVRQVFHQSEGKRHWLEADVRCRTDALGTPQAWTLASRFDGDHMEGLPPMAFEASGRIAGGAWESSSGGRTLRRTVPEPATADWCLFEAVQRLPLTPADPLRFTVLEGLGVAKADHLLAYDGPHEVTWGPTTVALHRFRHHGRGVYPYEWWVDGSHRLVLVVTGPRTYILDPKAEGLLA